MPPGVLMRLIQPWVRLRLRLLGWYSLPRALRRTCCRLHEDTGPARPRGSSRDLDRTDAARSWKGEAATCRRRRKLGREREIKEINQRGEAAALPQGPEEAAVPSAQPRRGGTGGISAAAGVRPGPITGSVMLPWPRYRPRYGYRGPVTCRRRPAATAGPSPPPSPQPSLATPSSQQHRPLLAPRRRGGEARMRSGGPNTAVPPRGVMGFVVLGRAEPAALLPWRRARGLAWSPPGRVPAGRPRLQIVE